MGEPRVARSKAALLAALSAALVVLWWLAEEGALERDFGWDPSLLDAAAKVEGGAFEAAMTVFSFFGAGSGLLLLLSGVVLALGRRRRFGDVLFVMAGLLLAQVLNRAVKLMVGRPRPSRPDLETLQGIADLRTFAFVAVGATVIAVLTTRRRGAAVAFSAIFAGCYLLYEIAAPAALSPGSASFPSGHATSSMAFAVGFVFIVPAHLRWHAVAAAAVFVVGVGLSRLGVGVHYPSDVLGGWALALASVLALRLVWPRAAGRVRIGYAGGSG